MSKLKFRAWDGEKMQPLFSINSATGEVVYNGEVKDWPLIQFTGLLDKNGVEIYEGDILSEDDSIYSKCKNRLYIVERDNTCLSFVLSSVNKYPCNGLKFIPHVSLDCKVIGNIYQNPELLGEDHE